MLRAVFFSIVAIAISSLPALAAPPTVTNRIWVSGHGSDTAGCSAPSTPCRSLQYAHDNITPGGEIDILDPAGYGAVTITKSIGIVNDGVGTAGLQQSNGALNAITITASTTDKIYLRGLNIDGLGLGGNGILVTSAGSVEIVNCTVRHFQTGDAINVQPTSGSLKLFITDVLIADNANAAIDLFPHNTFVKATLKGLTIQNNKDGILAQANDGTSAYVGFVLFDSTVSGQAGRGIMVIGNPSLGANAFGFLNHVTSYNNNIGLNVQNDSAFVDLTRYHSSENQTSIFSSASAGT